MATVGPDKVAIMNICVDNAERAGEAEEAGD
jgi:hypothetical protein